MILNNSKITSTPWEVDQSILNDPFSTDPFKHDNTYYSLNASEMYDLKLNAKSEELKREIDNKISLFLSFLEIKGIVQKGEYEAFLNAIDVAKRLSE